MSKLMYKNSYDDMDYCNVEKFRNRKHKKKKIIKDKSRRRWRKQREDKINFLQNSQKN